MNYKDRCKGAFIGLAVGDALGTTLEFTRRDTYVPLTDIVGGGPFEMNPGEWTDDTSMALCMAESIIARGKVAPDDILYRFYKWMRYGENSVKGYCFDIGGATATGIRSWMKNQTVVNNLEEEKSGNGGIMRLAPAVICAWSDLDEAIGNAIETSDTTHGSETCADAAFYMAYYMWNLIHGVDQKPVVRKAKFAEITNTDYTKVPRKKIRSSGYVMHTLEAAIWALENTDNFKDAVLLAANLGDDADTVAAVTGQLAGAKYGFSAIPKKWREILCMGDYLEDVAELLYEIGNKGE